MSLSDQVSRLPEPQHFYLDLYLSCHVMPFWMFLPLLHLMKRPVEQPARLRASWVCLRVCVCCCVSAGRQDVRSIDAGEANPVTLTCCGFEAPTSSATLSVILLQLLLPLLSECVFFLLLFLCSKTPKVTFSSTSHTFHLKPSISRKLCHAALFFPGLFLRAKMKSWKFF